MLRIVTQCRDMAIYDLFYASYFQLLKKYYLLVTAFQNGTFRNILLYHDQGNKKMSWAFWL